VGFNPNSVQFGSHSIVRPWDRHFRTARVSERTFKAGVPSLALGVRKNVQSGPYWGFNPRTCLATCLVSPVPLFS